MASPSSSTKRREHAARDAAAVRLPRGKQDTVTGHGAGDGLVVVDCRDIALPSPPDHDHHEAAWGDCTRGHGSRVGAAAHATTAEACAAAPPADGRSYAQLLEEVTQLREALTSRATIDQAKGIVMAERHCDPDTAFAVLTGLSQESNVKLRDVAAALVYQVTGTRGDSPPAGVVYRDCGG